MGAYGIFQSQFKILTGSDSKADTLSNRIISQKVAYLIYKSGLASRYTDFCWYLHGVFSWNLWNDTLKSCDILEDISEAERISLEDFKSKLESSELYNYLSDSSKLELITTVLYYSQKTGDLVETNSELISTVKCAKSKFNEDEIKTAISLLKKITWKF